MLQQEDSHAIASIALKVAETDGLLQGSVKLR
jgi:hypothetical protein